MEPYLKLETVMEALESYDESSRQAAALACRYLSPGQSVLKKWAHFPFRPEHVAAALYSAGGNAPLKWIKLALRRGDYFTRRAAAWAVKEYQYIPMHLLSEIVQWASQDSVAIELAERCRGRKIPYRQLQRIMSAGNYTHTTRLFLYRVAEWDRRIPDDWLWECLILVDHEWGASQATLVNTLRARGITDDEIRQRYRDAQNLSIDGRDIQSQALFMLMKGHGPIDLIETELTNHPYSLAAAEATIGMDVDLETLERWRFSEASILKTAAMYASIGRSDVPAEWIEPLLLRGYQLSNNCYETRLSPTYAARLAAFSRPDIPPIRTVEPKRKVYKYCIGGVKVFGQIPETAEIRVAPSCDDIRVSQVDVAYTEGTFFGERIGIARQDGTTLYRPGERTEVKDFDPRDACCLPGLHFILPQD